MRLLNILWRQKAKILIVVLAFLISFLTISPILKGGTDKVFYAIDPDVVYAANAFLYAKSGYVSYFDHPGTPAIVLISFFLIPLRIYAKFVQHTPFISWVFNHYALTFFYLRVSQSVLLFTSLLILSVAMRLLVKKMAPIFLLFLALLSFSSFYDIGATISADTFAFFIASVWLLLLSHCFIRKDNLFLFLLALTAGIAFADRATNFFLLPASLAVVLIEKNGFREKILMTFFSVVIMVTGFVIGVSPTRTHLTTILKTIFGFASTTGIHMSGEKTLFSYKAFISSAATFFYRDTLATVIVIAVTILAITCLFMRQKSYKKIAFVVLIFSLGAVVFAKFPLLHYQIANYLVIVFCGAFIFARLPKRIVYLVMIILLFFVMPISKEYLTSKTMTLNQAGFLEQFAKDNPPKYASVWQWAPIKEYAYLWNRDYADGMFDTELSGLPVKIYELTPNLMKIGVSKYTDVNIFSTCWDELYVNKSSINSILNRYPELSKSVQEIPGVDMLLLRSSHCQTMKF